VRQQLDELTVATRGAGLYEITQQVVEWVAGASIGRGLLTLHVRHTSASLVIQENADPDVRDDLERFFRRLVPRGDSLFRHTVEGPDDMPAHVRAALTATSLSVPIFDGALALGTWQGIYLWEHRDAPHRRRIAAHAIGE
jgi:secondary thiamine-phosphate synthase enzyme